MEEEKKWGLFSQPEEEEKQPAYMRQGYKQPTSQESMGMQIYILDTSGKTNFNSQGEKVTLSKALSKVLRHQAGRYNINVASDGFVDLSELIEKFFMKNKSKIPTLADIENVVENNEKKRFELVKDGSNYKIRAVQGHTMTTVKNEDLLTPMTINLNDKSNVFEFSQVIHGTYNKVL